MRFGVVTIFAFALSCADEKLVRLPDEPQLEPELEDDPPPPATSGDDCTSDSDCGPNAECEAGTCVGVGRLQVTLTFFVDADYDLHVITPRGNEIYYFNPSADGGVLDVDQCVFECGPGPHVENIFFNTDPISGPYTAFVVNYDGRDGGEFRIDVSGAASATLAGSLLDFAGERSDDLHFFVD